MKKKTKKQFTFFVGPRKLKQLNIKVSGFSKAEIKRQTRHDSRTILKIIKESETKS